MEWPTTKDTARAAGMKYYQTGAACIHGHIAERLVSTGACAECNRIRSREAQRKLWAEDPDAMRHKAREAYQAKPEHYRAKAREWRDDNLEKQREYERRYNKENANHLKMKARENRRANIDTNLERERAYGQRWRDQNRGRQRSYWRRRHAVKLHATPAWLTDEQNEAMVCTYEQAERLTRETGILHEVDHIIPLNHPDVCGLHVPWNLQVLSLPENRQKSNSFDGSMDNEGWHSL